MKYKYSRVLSRHLKILALAGVEGRDYVSSFREFVDLFEQLDEAASAGIVSPTQRDAIQAVFDCIDRVTTDINNGLLDYNVYSDAGFQESPAWEPMREAARSAIKVLES